MLIKHIEYENLCLKTRYQKLVTFKSYNYGKIDFKSMLSNSLYA